MHLLQFDNFECLASGQRRIFNLSHRRSKRRRRTKLFEHEVGHMKSNVVEFVPRSITKFCSSMRHVRILILHCPRTDEESSREKERRVQWEWLIAVIRVKREKESHNPQPSSVPSSFPFISYLKTPSLLGTPRMSARDGQRCKTRNVFRLRENDRVNLTMTYVIRKTKKTKKRNNVC